MYTYTDPFGDDLDRPLLLSISMLTAMDHRRRSSTNTCVDLCYLLYL